MADPLDRGAPTTGDSSPDIVEIINRPLRAYAGGIERLLESLRPAFEVAHAIGERMQDFAQSTGVQQLIARVRAVAESAQALTPSPEAREWTESINQLLLRDPEDYFPTPTLPPSREHAIGIDSEIHHAVVEENAELRHRLVEMQAELDEERTKNGKPPSGTGRN